MAAIGEDGKAMALLTYVCVGEEITLGYTAHPIIDGKVPTSFSSMPLSTEPQSKEISFQSTPVRTPTTWPPKQHSKRKVGQKNTSRIPIR
ncbi:hypothetical protein [Sinorhizobium meliloti]|uniref:hypothetical protein n=1 Tax=Rhizobium meliloti TaxID=382 RepID=UPI001D110EFB|nr:hypothetical protein [Sinorhizobium meliloti]MDE4604722.1 hypothetical protein [Sinorhizobium meliloti]UDU21268.1 hypothetical protein LJD24_17450 [Sinorhizobium meliloti]